MKPSASLLALLACALAAAPAAAQLTPLSVEVRGGPVSTLGDWATVHDAPHAEGGRSLEARVLWHFNARVAAYAGYARQEWDATPYAISGEGTFRDEGFAAGLRAYFPADRLPVRPWVGGGLVAHTFEAEGFEDYYWNVESDGATVGWEATAGADVPLVPHLALSPALRYTVYRTDLVHAQYHDWIEHLMFGVGVRVRL